MFAGICARNVWMFAHWAWRRMSDCSYAAMSNHKLTVANLCVKSNSMWTNFADNGKIHMCMYNVCTLYTTAVGVISPRQLAHCLHRNEYDIWCNVCWTLVWGRVIGKLFEGKCWRGNVCGEICSVKCSARCARTAHASLMGAYAPKRSANRALSWEEQRSSNNIWVIVHMLFVGREGEYLSTYVVCWTRVRVLIERLFDFNLLCLQRMAQLSDLVIWCARNWWMFGATVFCSLRSHGTRLLLTQQSKPCLVMGKAGVCACVVIS